MVSLGIKSIMGYQMLSRASCRIDTKSVNIGDMFPTLRTELISLCPDKSIVSSVLLNIPSPTDHSFLKADLRGLALPDQITDDAAAIELLLESVYSVAGDETNSEEILFGLRRSLTSQGVVNEKLLGSFIAGRIAVRRAMQSVGAEYGDAAMLSNEHGAPQLPSTHSQLTSRTPSNSVSISISHKDHLALGVALASSKAPINGLVRERLGVFVGCDIELANTPIILANMVARRVLTPREVKRLGCVDLRKVEEIMLIFSFKESVFKALHSILQRQIDFNEVEVQVSNDGTAKIHLRLRSITAGKATDATGGKIVKSDQGHAAGAKLCLQCDAQWQRYEDTAGDRNGKEYFLTFVRVESL